MARLSGVIKKLNISMNRAVEFLQKKGLPIDADLNAKLTEEQESLLYQEFSSDEALKQQSNLLTQKRQEEKRTTSVAIDGYNEEPEKKEEKSRPVVKEPEVTPVPTPEPKEVKVEPTPVPQPEPKKEEVKAAEKEPEVFKLKTEGKAAGLKTIGKLDLDQLNKKKKADTPKAETPKVEEKPQVATPEPEKVTPKVEETPAPETVEVMEEQPAAPKKTEVFKINHAKIEGPNVLGKIDLSTINSSTRPPKKTKEELKVERMEKSRQQTHTPAPADAAKQGGGENPRKGKRARIEGKRYERVVFDENDHSSKQGGKNFGGNKSRRPIRPDVDEEDVQRQVKETLARLTSKDKKIKGDKYRREKRQERQKEMEDLATQEMRESKVLKLTEFVTANELATMMGVAVTQIIATCMNMGLFVSINQRLDAETINIVADEFGFKTEYVSAEVVNAIKEEVDKEEDLQSRPPIVTVMGHVDHGKTSLLDYIRKTNVIAGEAGGITQHIGAYNVKLEDGRHITFLDTPGHEAFTAMRARGAKVTDLAIIIVAADDDVMPQTIEAINHASVAGVPIVFAINKIDKPGANPEKVKESLANMNYLVEDWGGKYQSQDISAKQGIGVNELLEKVLLEADMLDLKANPNRKAVGSVIESSLDKGRGYVATVLVSNGTLHVGDVVLAGTAYGRIKAMFNERNQRIKVAGPSEPAIILGLNGAPQAGDNFNVFADEHEAREIANKREQLQREQGLRTSTHLTLEEIGRRKALGDFHEVNVIVKGDVDGSIEALSDSLIKLSTEEIQVNVIHKAVGQISESDVLLAAASNAIIIGFQVRPSVDARKAAEREQVDIRLYSIIYDAIEELKAAMEGMLSPEIKEEITATLEVRATFKISKVGTIAGCMVKDGKIKRTNRVRVIRDGIVVYTGELASLKHEKEDVKEMASGMECGLNITSYNDIHEGDVIEAFEQVEVKKSL